MSMKTLPKSDIPEYLKHGELYRTLVENNDDLDELVTFPASVLKPDLSVDSMEDCDHLLESLRFWGLPCFIPKELVRYVMFVPSFEESVGVLAKYAFAFFYIRIVIEMAATSSPERMMNVAIRSGVTELVEAIAEHGFPANACDVAAETGDLNMLNFLRLQDCNWTKYTGRIAASHGYKDMLEYICVRGYTATVKDQEAAAAGGHLDCLKALAELRTPKLYGYREIGVKAVDHGHLHIMHYVDGYFPWSQIRECVAVAKNGHLECLRFLYGSGCEWGEDACKLTAEGGHIDCLRFMHEHGCQWDEGMCETAAGKGHLDCLIYVHDNGCAWGVETCADAAKGGHLDCLQHLHENGCPWDNNTCVRAASRGHLACLQYAHGNGCPWDGCATVMAAIHGRLECLKYLHDNGCPGSEACEAMHAIKGGHLDCVKYMHEKGWTFSKDASTWAANYGHLSCLKYLHELGIPYIADDFIYFGPRNPCYEYVQQHFT